MQAIKLFINKNKTAFIVAVVIFFAGSIFGSVSLCRLEPSETDELKEYISPYLESGAASNVEAGAIFAQDCANHIRFVCQALLCALSVYLVPVFAFVLAVKGYQLGFSMGFVCANFGAKGIYLALSSTLISYLLAVPLYFYVFVHLVRFAASMRNSIHMSIRERRREYFSYFLLMIVVCSLLCAIAGLGALVTPLIVDFMN